MQSEIDHLLLFVENTECMFERNGTSHSGKEAVEHIKKKYNYYKDEIDSAEKFIKLSATKSTLSGKYYMILCNGRPIIKSQDWLLQELKNYRRKNANTSFNLDSRDTDSWISRFSGSLFFTLDHSLRAVV